MRAINGFQYRIVRQLSALIIIVLCFGNSIFVHAKAVLAQRLIATAWEKQISSGEIIKPWAWADTWPVAKLKISNTQKTLYVLQGGHGESLAFGPGLLHESQNPETSGTKIIGGHRDTHFSFLKDIARGERIEIQDRFGRWREYIISETNIVDIRNGPWQYEPNINAIHLITCYPFDSPIPGGPMRFVAIAEAI